LLKVLREHELEDKVCMVVDNPAKQIGWVCECGESLDGKLTCTECGKIYKDVKNGLKEK
jgi:UDP-2-acetamido-3-amino-2,3-dideoxy-glucuronate N-acetyltransferase